MEYTVGKKVFKDWEIVRKIGEDGEKSTFELRRKSEGGIESALLYVIIVPGEAELEKLRKQSSNQKRIDSCFSLKEYYRKEMDRKTSEIARMALDTGITDADRAAEYSVQEHTEGIGWDILVRMEAVLVKDGQNEKNSRNKTEEVIQSLGSSSNSAASAKTPKRGLWTGVAILLVLLAGIEVWRHFFSDAKRTIDMEREHKTTEIESAAETESEKETESAAETEGEKETESEKETGSKAETESEKETERAAETESEKEIGQVVIWPGQSAQSPDTEEIMSADSSEQETEDEIKEFLDELYEKISAEDGEGLFSSLGIPVDTPIYLEETLFYQNGNIVGRIDSGYGMRVSGSNVYLGEFKDSEPNGNGIMFYCAGYDAALFKQYRTFFRYYRMLKGTWDNGIMNGYFEVYCSNGYYSDYEVVYSGNIVNGYWDGDVIMNWTRISDGFKDSGVIHARNGEFPVIRQEGEKYVFVVGESGMYWSTENPDQLKNCGVNF